MCGGGRSFEHCHHDPIERGAATEAEWTQTCAVSRLSEFEAGAGERSVVVVGAMFVRGR